MTPRYVLVPFLAGVVLDAWTFRSSEHARAAADNDRKKLEGTWSLWRSVKSGDTTADSGEGMIVDATTIQLTLRGKPLAEKGTYSVKADADPREIDFEHTAGRYKGKKQLGIYKFTGPASSRSAGESLARTSGRRSSPASWRWAWRTAEHLSCQRLQGARGRRQGAQGT